MPIVVRPEDIKLSKKKLRKDLLYSIGLEEGKQIGLEEGLLIKAQELALKVIKGKLGYVPERVIQKIRQLKDRTYLHGFVKRLINIKDMEGLLKEGLGLK